MPGINLAIRSITSFGVNKKKAIATPDSIKVVTMFVCLSTYSVIKLVPINKPKLTPKRFPSFNKPPSNPEKASRLSWDKLETFAKLNINPVTTPTVDPVAAPAINANTSTKYLVKIC